MKRFFILLITVILLAGVWLSYDHALYVKRKAAIAGSIGRVASEMLCGDFTSIVQAGNSTRMLIADAAGYELLWGDADAPIGDGRADLHLIIMKEDGTRIGLRMKYDAVRQKYHILGYWTLQPGDPPNQVHLNGTP